MKLQRREPGGLRLLTIVVAVIGSLAISLSVPSAWAASAFVRVNQVGYPAAGAKRAYLMSSVAETGATFSVKNSTGMTVFSGPIGAKLGSWSGTYSFVYALDFGTLTTAGTHTISVSGPAAAS